jgi:hypothetical protein
MNWSYPIYKIEMRRSSSRFFYTDFSSSDPAWFGDDRHQFLAALFEAHPRNPGQVLGNLSGD